MQKRNFDIRIRENQKGEYKDKDGGRLPTIQLIVTEQGLCTNWCENIEQFSEREFTHSQDYPCLDELDEEVIAYLLEYGLKLQGRKRTEIRYGKGEQL